MKNDIYEFYIRPSASRTIIEGLYGDKIKVRLSSPPEKGKANKELQRFLAALLGIKSKDVQIQSGQTSCVKQLFIKGAEKKHVQSLFSK